MDTQALKRQLLDALERECKPHLEPAANEPTPIPKVAQCFVTDGDYREHFVRSTGSARIVPMRKVHDPECSFCRAYQPGDFFPPHDASPYCESGHRTHCTCDTCF